MRSIVRCIAALAACASPLVAVDFSGVDLKPLLNLRYDADIGSQHNLPPEVNDATYLITRGGATTGFTTYITEFPGTSPTGGMLQALATPPNLNTLKLALSANHIGQQRDCGKFFGSLPGPVSYEIRWYGTGRRAGFTVYNTGGNAHPELEICGDEAERILAAVLKFIARAHASPGAEVWQSK